MSEATPSKAARRMPWSPVAFPHVRPTPKSIGREGMVTVWASDGLYLGCMGVETWKRVLEEGTDGA